MKDAADNLPERDKMARGLPYDAMKDKELIRLRLRARKLLKQYNVRSRATD